MLSSSAPDEAFQRFDVLAGRHADALRQLTKKVQDARLARDTEALKHAVIAYEEALEAYIPGNIWQTALLDCSAMALTHRGSGTAVHKPCRIEQNHCTLYNGMPTSYKGMHVFTRPSNSAPDHATVWNAVQQCTGPCINVQSYAKYTAKQNCTRP